MIRKLVVPFVIYLFSFFLHAKTIISPEYQVNLVEVYTSQGCSSCPPAEHWLGKFKDDSRLFNAFIPINLHVDYWDYLGWKDPYANAKFSQRQRLYQALGHAKNVATPGFVVNGKGWNGWFRGREIPVNNDKKVGRLTVNIADNKTQNLANITFDSYTGIKNISYVHVAILAFDQHTQVPKGENKGKLLPHDFVVIGYKNMVMKYNDNQLNAELILPNIERFSSPKKALVVWVSQGKDPSPIQATGDWF